jgi:hypothetical protein
MAEKCANCGRADLLMADVANYQCLACGALTSMETGQVVTPVAQNAELSNMGFPVTEMSKDVQEAEPNDFNRRDRPGDEDRPTPAFTGTTGTFDVSGETGDTLVQEVSDDEGSHLVTLTPEAVHAIDTVDDPESAPFFKDEGAPFTRKLTPEQIEAIQRIAYPDGATDG